MEEVEKKKEETIKDVKNPIPMKVHPCFRQLLCDLQNERIVNGMENVQGKIPLYKLSKTITNLILSNPKIKKMLIDVQINDN